MGELKAIHQADLAHTLVDRRVLKCAQSDGCQVYVGLTGGVSFIVELGGWSLRFDGVEAESDMSILNSDHVGRLRGRTIEAVQIIDATTIHLIFSGGAEWELFMVEDDPHGHELFTLHQRFTANGGAEKCCLVAAPLDRPLFWSAASAPFAHTPSPYFVGDSTSNTRR